MPPSEFSLRLQHGITGGFAPPTPSAIHTLTAARSEPPTLTITSAVRPPGEPELRSVSSIPKSLSLSTSNTTAPALVDELHSILKSIPTESPPGSEDIYGLDTSIAWGSEDLLWCNGGPEGCGGGPGSSHVKASAEDKKKFKRAVEIVNQLVESAA